MASKLNALDIARLPAEVQRALADTLVDIAQGRACEAHGLRVCRFGCGLAPEEPRVPEWVRRAREGALPAKTRYGA